jgi:HlyD family secretion protein
MNDPGTSVATPPPARASRPRRFPMLAAGLIFLGLSGAAVGYYFYEKHGQEPAEHGQGAAAEQGPAPGLPVEVAHPRPGGIEKTTNQASSVHAFEHATLFAKVSGYLKEQGVDIGDRVKLGQLLAEIEDPEVDKAVEQARASLDQSRARVRVAESKIRSAKAAKEAADALVQVSEQMVPAKVSNLDLQEKQLTRIAGLVARNAIEDKLEDEQKDRRDVARADVGVARAEVISARAEVMNKAAMIEGAQADLVEAQANVEVAEANLAKAQVIQDYTKIRSPFDGVITLRSFHPGDFVRSATEGGNVPVLAVAVTNKMRVVVPIPDTDVPFVNVGDTAVLQIVALPGRTFTGTVSRFSYTEDPESRIMRTEVDLPNVDGTIREGMYGNMRIILQAAAPDSVTIPSSGLLGQTGTGAGSVYVVKDGKAHKVNVQVGIDNGVETEILKGLSTEDLVVTSYNGSIEDGTPVKSEPRKAAPTSGH